MKNNMEEEKTLVCVLCGTPWIPPILNRCPNPECDGFCTWGEKKGGQPSSWDINKNGKWIPKSPPKNLNKNK